MPIDGILTEITNDAIHLVNPSMSIDLTANLWFSIASVVMLTVLIAPNGLILGLMNQMSRLLARRAQGK